MSVTVMLRRYAAGRMWDSRTRLGVRFWWLVGRIARRIGGETP